MAAHHAPPHAVAPTAAAKASGAHPWDRPLHWAGGAWHHLVQAAGWLVDQQHVAELVVIGIPLFVLLATLRTFAVWRLLGHRQQWAIVPTSRYPSGEKTAEDAYKNFSNALSHVRLRANVRQWWLRRAGALRIQLDTINRGGTIYSLGGPPWARTVVEVGGFAGLILVPMAELDPRDLSPKGLIVRPDEQIDHEPETDTDPELMPVPVGDPQ